MKQGELVNGFRVPPHPKGISLEGSFVILKPLTASQFANELFLSNAIDIEGINWAYLPYGPFDSVDTYSQWIKSFSIDFTPIE